MQKERRRAGGTEGGGDFLRDDAALAHAGDDYAAVRSAAAQNQLDRALKSASMGPSSRRREPQTRPPRCALEQPEERRGLQAVAIGRAFGILGVIGF